MGEIITSYLQPSKQANESDDMIDGELFNTEGRAQTLAQFRGKYILLDFWSSGCTPCIAAIPEIDQMGEKYADLVIVNVSIDSKSI